MTLRSSRLADLLCVLLLVAVAKPSGAQTPPSQPPPDLDLKAAVAQALERYPAIVAARARTSAAEARVGVAKTAYLPRVDAVWQENRATHNNIFGLLLPQSVIPSISGPVLGTTGFDSVWGSAGGLLMSWEPIDFGQRRAAVDVARADTTVAQAQTGVSQLSAATAAADAFLTLVATEQSLRAAQANVQRLQVFAESVRVLVNNQLRPGAEASRADAELAAARTQVEQLTEARNFAEIALADSIGWAGASVSIAQGPFTATLPDLSLLPAPLTQHPALTAGAAAVKAAEAREHVAERSMYPHVAVQGVVSGRGSGAKVADDVFAGTGAWLQVPNWAAGVTVSFPALEFLSARARERAEARNRDTEIATYNQTVDALRTASLRADAAAAAAAAIAKNTPVQLAAAQETESRARVRYENGLASITEVADAQRLLAQAEAEDAVAKVAVWRALLAQASTRGDLRLFLDRVP